MTTKKTTSRLFKGAPDQLFLDERVSKIALPTLRQDRAVFDEREANWGLDSHQESDIEEQTEALQVFVGVSKPTNREQEEASSEDGFGVLWAEEGLDSEDALDDLPMPMSLNLNQPIQEQVAEDPTVLISKMPLQSIQEVQEDEPTTSPLAENDWETINWDDVTLSDILGDMDDVDEVLQESTVSEGAELNIDIDDWDNDDWDPNEDTEIGGALLDWDEESLDHEIEGEQNTAFPALVSLDDQFSEEDERSADRGHQTSPLDETDEDVPGAVLNWEDDWFSEQEPTHALDDTKPEEISVLQVQSTAQPHSYRQYDPPPPPRIILTKPKSFWDDPFVRVWIAMLVIAFVAALLWRLFNG